MTRSLRVVAVLALLGRADLALPEDKALLIELPQETLAIAVGANGFVVAANAFSGGGQYWMPTSGVVSIGGTQTNAISRDGKTILGRALDSRGFENAAIWQGGREWRLLGSFTPNAQACDRLLSGTFGASADGKVVVGLGWNGCRIAHAFRWEESTGMVDLGAANATSSRANSVSGDGRVVVGWVEDVTGFRRGAKWVDGAQEIILNRNGHFVGEAFGANSTGSIVVGANCDPTDSTGPTTGWTWTPATGIQCYPVRRPADIPNYPYQTQMYATSEDGRVIGGAFTFGLESQSLVWIDGESFFLKDYLRANGVADAFEGWVNTGFVLDVTPDGRTLVGYGAGPRSFQGFMVVLPELPKR